MALRKIAFYGKAGIGKPTIACNLSIALTEVGERVFLMDQVMEEKITKIGQASCLT